MEDYRVIFDEGARNDLTDIFDYVVSKAGDRIARDWVGQIYGACVDLKMFPERGTRRDDIREGFRTIGFRHRVTILFRVDAAAFEVVILGIYYGGRDLESFWSRDGKPAGEPVNE